MSPSEDGQGEEGARAPGGANPAPPHRPPVDREPERTAAPRPDRVPRLDGLLEPAGLEADPIARADLVLAALAEFLRRVPGELARAHRVPIEQWLVECAAHRPGATLRFLPTATGTCGLTTETIRTVLGGWMRDPDAGTFAASWTAATTVTDAAASVRTWWIEAVRAREPEVSVAFRALAERHLTDLVDARFDELGYAGATSPVWQMMYAIGPGSRAEWFVRLGDRAARREDFTEATRRYEMADRFGAARARLRLAQLADVDAYRTLRRGEPLAEPRGPGEPSAYRSLLRATSAVVRGTAAGVDPDEVARTAADPRIRDFAQFLTALDRLRAGGPGKARAVLRDLVGRSPAAGADHDVRANARLVLGLLDGDDRTVVAGVRSLLERHGDRWSDRAVVAPAPVLVAVARSAPELLLHLDVAARQHDSRPEHGAIRVAAARAGLAAAARAALLARPGEARELLDRAHVLLGTVPGADADGLRAAAARIAELVAAAEAAGVPERALDRLAYAALRVDGVPRPSTPEALRIWQEIAAESGADPASLHHLAIAQHARAYAMEPAGSGAVEHWETALGHWARLHGDPRFWELLRGRLSRAMPDAAASEIDAAVEAARTALPGHLLGVHVRLAGELVAERRAGAEAHVRLVRTAPFSAAEVARARTALIRDVAGRTRRLAREGQVDKALDEVQRWIEMDPDSVPLAELVLDIVVAAADAATLAEDWAEPIPYLERAGTLVRPIRDALGLTTERLAHRAPGMPPVPIPEEARDLADKLARYEFWLGGCVLTVTVRHSNPRRVGVRADCERAATHLQAAVRLGLPARDPYNWAGEWIDVALKSAANVGNGFGFG